jgi:lipopolysaccharide transport system ATP-binding protein
MEYEVLAEDGTYYVPDFHIYSVENVLVFIASPQNGAINAYEKGRYKAVCEIPPFLLNEGVFRVTLALSSGMNSVTIHFAVPHSMTFKVVDDLTEVSYRNGYMHVIPGMFRPQLAWKVGKIV